MCLSINISEIAVQLATENKVIVDHGAMLSEVLLVLSAPHTNGMNLSGMLISGINVVEHYGNFDILTFQQKDLLGNFLMENIELKNKMSNLYNIEQWINV